VERPQTKDVDVGGAEVAYQVVGEGPPDVIDVPGFSHVDLLWDDPIAAPFLERLASFGAAAGPGEGLVSSTVKDLIVGSGIKLEDRGEHELKGVPGSWRLYGAVS
jgi:hypothetical protein